MRKIRLIPTVKLGNIFSLPNILRELMSGINSMPGIYMAVYSTIIEKSEASIIILM
jgi:hypothetical protein